MCNWKSIFVIMNNNLTLIAFFFICSIIFIHAESNVQTFFDEYAYAVLESLLNFHNDTERRQCVMKNLRIDNVAEKFYKLDFNNVDKMKEVLQPHVDNANNKCRLEAVMQHPLVWGICIIVALILFFIIRCLIRRCRR